MRADRYEAPLDFLLEAVSDQGMTPFPAHVLAGMRRVIPCETVAYAAPVTYAAPVMTSPQASYQH